MVRTCVRFRLGGVLVVFLALAMAASARGQAPIAGPRPAVAPRPGIQPKSGAGKTVAAPSGRVERTRAEVEAIIQKAGTTPPDWWNSVPLTYPKTLELTWTQPPKGTPFTASKYLGQYIWGTINENPARWREGAKLMHHVLTVNKDDTAKLARTMEALARIYHELLADWARAAFWMRKAAVTDTDYADDVALELAHCYWKLGSKEMAATVLGRYQTDNTAGGNVIRLWADIGELDSKALPMAEAVAREGYPDIGYLAAGDSCRLAGRYPQALDYYQKVLAATTGWNQIKRNKTRAQNSIDGIRAAQGLDLTRVRDGTYTASSMGYAGPVEVAVTVAGGRILSVKVTKYQEKQYYTALTDTPAEIVRLQGIKGVEAVSSATITSEAIMNATMKALAQGMK
jgi:uncharacterized protein with FMN-binding domain